MPRRDPFADKRKTTPCNGSPIQARKKKKNRRNLHRYYNEKTAKELGEKQKELTKVERELEVRKHLLQMMEDAPSISQQRKIIFSMFKEAGFNPIQALVDYVTETDEEGNLVLPLKDRITLTKELASYYAPKPKSVDIQADIQGNMTINVVDFSKVTQSMLKQAAEAPIELPHDGEYEEFLSPEEREAARRKAKLEQQEEDVG